jgi:hypothetical protein
VVLATKARPRIPMQHGVYVVGRYDCSDTVSGLYRGKPCRLFSILVMGGTAPGVLFRVLQRCVRSVFFSALSTLDSSISLLEVHLIYEGW